MPGRKVGFNDPVFAGAKVVDVTTTLTNNNGGSINTTIEDERIIGGMRLISLEVSNPEAIGANINFHPAYGELTITCDDIEGSTNIKASFLKIDDDPTTISSSEYDILNNKIELIKNVDVNFPITIETTDWALDNESGHYVYTWTNSAVTTECSVDVQFLESQDDADVDCVYSEKVTGGVQFSVDYVPSVDIPVNIKITNTRPKAINDITGEMVATDVISGASNVDEALNALNSNSQLNNLDTGIDLINYNSESNKYTFTGDGYVHINSSNGYILVVIYSADETQSMRAEAAYESSIPAIEQQIIYVKKGMKVYTMRSSDATAIFYKLV